ncbi:MAG: thrombospondin type 3 repeat-containing protein, partial [Gammaproteobacteria bacterium]|nr:thrombospondin type 3 repeat-containing protein [Gammaproteobacteria bacterium]
MASDMFYLLRGRLTHLTGASLMLMALIGLNGCSKSEDNADQQQEETVKLSKVVSGGGVKGPLAFADVEVFAFDANNSNYQGDTAIATGSTDEKASFKNLSIPSSNEPPFILVFTANDNTVDLTTGAKPVISVMRTVVTQSMLDAGNNIYATPLTTMAVDVAIKNALSNVAPYAGTDFDAASKTVDKFLLALPIAQKQVKSTLGFGMGKDVDLFTTSPLVDEATDSETALNNTAQYRVAVEAASAIVEGMKELSSNVSTDDMLSALSEDLADGEIDGKSSGSQIAIMDDTKLAVLDQDPDKLVIPGSTKTVADVIGILKAETADTGNALPKDSSGTEIQPDVVATQPAVKNPDIDGDGVLNADDAFPAHPGADIDTDGDGFPDVAYVVTNGVRTTTINTTWSDSDDDNDGVEDANDAFPLDPTKSAETNSTATDSDGDGVPDAYDAFPDNVAEWKDTDGDGTGDNSDTDIDGDGVLNAADKYPTFAGADSDTDGDGVPDVVYVLDGSGARTATVNTDLSDDDDDNDGVLDVNEATGCELKRDCDGDKRLDGKDAFPSDANEWIDTDGDGTGNNADTDDDGDGTPDATDLFPYDSNESADSDSDGVGDNKDNCPAVANTLQRDQDEDGIGDKCDSDIDGDTVANADDAFPFNPAESVDTDGDKIGNNEDTDDDGDGVADSEDAFPLDPTRSVASNTASVNGVFKFSIVAGATTSLVGDCSVDAPTVGSTVNESYFTVKVNGSSIFAATPDGELGNLVYNSTNQSFTYSDTHSSTSGSDEYSESNSGTATFSNGSWQITGTVVNSTTSSGTKTSECSLAYTGTSALVYTPTGSEDYSGQYAVEIKFEQDGVSKAAADAVYIVTTSSDIKLIDGHTDDVVFTKSFDPTTGYFEYKAAIDDRYDYNNDSVTDVVRDIGTWKGIFIRAPGTGTTPVFYL